MLTEEKPVGFRLKPPTLIHGQAPSSGWSLLLLFLHVYDICQMEMLLELNSTIC